jgi:hypothetical protein
MQQTSSSSVLGALLVLDGPVSGFFFGFFVARGPVFLGALVAVGSKLL